MADYKATLNLPKTELPMKADLPKREPEMLAHWQAMNLYAQIRATRKGNPLFILHDGPPYANANIHMGTALNKTLKDIVVKSKTLSGYDAPYVPGWDCHGLPIELNVEKKHGKVGDKLDAKQFRQACREYATTQVALQKADFERLGVLGDWENPYLTMQPDFEANAVRALAKMVEKGHLLRGQKPVHWCALCGSALAEAEVDYQDKTSPAIDVGFVIVNTETLQKHVGTNIAAPISIVIWTTTPWTLPANEAIAVNPELTYALVEANIDHQKKYFVVAESLVDSVMQRFTTHDYTVLGTTLGINLEGMLCQHPFLTRQVPIILGDHVTAEAGTGCVHTAPAHGQDDFMVGQKYSLPMQNPVNSKSCYNDDVPFFAGLHVFKANEPIIEKLRETGHLLHLKELKHSYPHCWRHKTPLIFRATPQWFISMDQNQLRTLALDAIKAVKWIPSWGEQRIHSMVDSRPDWCISRQRAWGIPITLLIHKQTGELHPDILSVMEKAAKLIEKDSIDAWHDCAISDLIENADDYEKVTDVLDVWFESGVTHASVLAARPHLRVPADLYLEGSDQHRGWFQSSLLTSVAMRDAAPYKSVLTHGYVVDAQGRKMSKSLGNTISPADIVKNYGADVLRLWAMSIDHTDDMSVSDEILKRASDTYRRIRNTIRFLLSNLFDFNPETDCVAAENLVALDAYIIERTKQVQNELRGLYDTYAFPAVYHAINNFCTIELGSRYLDIIKDRQYTSATNGLPRRATQTAMYYILEALVRWIAPVMSFTADEAWRCMPGKREDSIFLTTWFENFPIYENKHAIQWETLLTIRDNVSQKLEELRRTGQIGSSLNAAVTFTGSKEACAELKKLGDELRFFFITSETTIIEDANANPMQITATVSAGTKCERCWHYRIDVGADTTHPTLCERCIENAFGEGEKRQFA